MAICTFFSVPFMRKLPLYQLPIFFLALLFFHSSEFLLALIVHGRHNVSASSFLLSKKYVISMLYGLVEYGLEGFLIPDLKRQPWISTTGMAMIVFGELVRKLAILTANQNFTHEIRVNRCENHELITHGIYSLVRHPGYLGFFVWSIGTQMLLCNPLCTVGYTVITWRYFAHRIQYEEYFLRQFFGSQYEDYVLRVPSGIPFVK